MPTVVPNAFTSLKFSEDEEKEMREVSPLHKLFLINMRAEEAKRQLGLRLDLQKPGVFAQDHAYVTGRIELLTELIGDGDK